MDLRFLVDGMKLNIRSGIMIIKDNKILLHKNDNKDNYCLPGGGVKFLETSEEAIIREIKEETGISDIEIKHIAYVSILEGEMPNLLIVYFCETATDNVKVSFEHQAYIWADEEKCRALLPKAIISDFEKNHVFDILYK